MDLRRIRRLATVLVTSEIRSGRSTSDPRSLFGRPLILLLIDAGVFVPLLLLGAFGMRRLGASAPPEVALLAAQLLLLLPILATGIVLVAGIMFEFSTGSRFSGSDAVNWFPVTPREYVIASSLAVTLAYSPPVAFVLGIAGALGLALGLFPSFVLAALLSVVALFEGGVLIELLRSATQRATSALSGRKGRLTLVLRAGLFLVVVLLFELAFNPLFLVGLFGAFSGLAEASTFIPFFWATRALSAWFLGNQVQAALFVVGQLAFVGFLVYAAAEVRVRLWSPAPAEVKMEPHAFGAGHSTLKRLGLDRRESSLLWKDLVGLGRRREMLPILVIPVVLAVIGFLQPGVSATEGPNPTLSWWGAWISGFFALMLSSTSLGQERRAVQSLFAYPISGRTLFRAKVAECLLLPSALGTVVNLCFAIIYRFPLLAEVGMAVTSFVAILAGTFIGLSIATRYSDFQDRPRAQFVRPWPMMAGIGAGTAVIFAIVVLGHAWLFSAAPYAMPDLAEGLIALAVGAAVVPLAFGLARRGADRFLEELPT